MPAPTLTESHAALVIASRSLLTHLRLLLQLAGPEERRAHQSVIADAEAAIEQAKEISTDD